MDVFKLKDESLILKAESLQENEFSDNEEVVTPKKFSPENDEKESPRHDSEKEDHNTKSLKNIIDNDSNILSSHLLHNESKTESVISKYQEIILTNLNGEAKFDKLMLEAIKVPEKFKSKKDKNVPMSSFSQQVKERNKLITKENTGSFKKV